MESATLTESILQMSCLSGQLCQVCCGWGQGQPGRSSEVRAPSGSQTPRGTAPSVQSQMKAGSLRLSLSFYGSSCDFTYSADNKWRLVSFSHSKPKVCLKLENVLKYIGSKNLADWDTIFAEETCIDINLNTKHWQTLYLISVMSNIILYKWSYTVYLTM